MSAANLSVLLKLTKRREFLAANKASKAVTNSFILQSRYRGDDSDDVRVGFTASKKVGNAVIRNLAKRRMRALAREMITKNGKSGHDYVLIARRDATTVFPFEVLRKDLKKALEKLSSARSR